MSRLIGLSMDRYRSRGPVRRPATAIVLSLGTAAVLVLGGCGQQSQSPDARETLAGKEVPSADPTTATDDQMTHLLQLNHQLKSDLGSTYSDAWIEGEQLHVAVTTAEAEDAVSGAGAVPHRSEFSAEELRQAVDSFKTWLGTDAAPEVQLHWLGTSGRTGTITVRVPADQVAALQAAADEQAPAGKVSVIVEESEGMATPLSTN